MNELGDLYFDFAAIAVGGSLILSFSCDCGTGDLATSRSFIINLVMELRDKQPSIAAQKRLDEAEVVEHVLINLRDFAELFCLREHFALLVMEELDDLPEEACQFPDDGLAMGFVKGDAPTREWVGGDPAFGLLENILQGEVGFSCKAHF